MQHYLDPWAIAAIEDVGQVGLDACTLNNALNVAQLIVLVALLKWVRQERPTGGS